MQYVPQQNNCQPYKIKNSQVLFNGLKDYMYCTHTKKQDLEESRSIFKMVHHM